MLNVIEHLITSELRPAVGCTEPISVAFTASVAGKTLNEAGSRLESVTVRLDKNVYKNGKDVSIPSPLPLRGNLYAAPLGALLATPEKGLEILRDVPEPLCHQAIDLVKREKVHLELDSQAQGLFVEVSLQGSGNHRVTARARHRHDQIVFMQHNDKVLLDLSESTAAGPSRLDLSGISFRDFFDFLETYEPTPEVSQKIIDSCQMNRKVMEKGLEGVGTGLGKKIIDLGRHGCQMNYIISHCAAAVDARMAGISLPVMSATGSGNQGLIIFLTHALYAESLPADPRRFTKSILLALFLASRIKAASGRLSALCGCVIASGMASAAGLAYLERLSRRQAEDAFHLMAADIMGILCDGAKSSCALKAATGVNSLLRSLKLVKMDFSIPAHYGIIGDSIDETIQNIGKISTHGMQETDQEILKIMTCQA